MKEIYTSKGLMFESLEVKNFIILEKIAVFMIIKLKLIFERINELEKKYKN